MIREIVKTEDNSLVLKLPDDMVGKFIEVIAFSVEELKGHSEKAVEVDDLEAFRNQMKKLSINSGGYKFNRDEANDYD